jgi:TRAP-type mannitol/chloroaromatic compound transport system substrate-binding protein
MQRRKFVQKALAASVGAGAAFACTKTPDETTKAARGKFSWRLVMVIPKTMPLWGAGVERFAARVNSITGGDLTIKVFGPGEAAAALGTFEAVKSGQVEMAHSTAYYWQDIIPAAPFFTSVPFGLNATGMNAWLRFGGGQELWDEAYAPHGLMALPAGNTGMQMGGWFKKEIKHISDFKGLKMRMPGLGAKVIQKAGAKPVLVAGGEIYTSLMAGTVDAADWIGPCHDYLLGLPKAAAYYYYPGWQEPGVVLELMINKQAWNQLPPDLQQVVRSCAAEINSEIHADWVGADARYLQKIVDEHQVNLRAFPEDVLRELRRHSDAVMREVVAADPLARKVYDSFSAFQKTYEALLAVTDKAPLPPSPGK